MKTYRRVEVQLLIFLPWLKVEVIGHLQTPAILLPSKKRLEYALYRPCGRTMPSKHHVAKEQFVCKEKLVYINIFLSGKYVNVTGNAVSTVFSGKLHLLCA